MVRIESSAPRHRSVEPGLTGRMDQIAFGDSVEDGVEALSAEHECSCDTAIPRQTGLRSVAALAHRIASSWMYPVMQRIAPAYVGGETLEDALAVIQRHYGAAHATTLGFWDAGHDGGREVANHYLSAIEQVAQRGIDCYLSIKPPALRFDARLINEIAMAAQAQGLRLHCDSHGPDVADQTLATAEMLLKQLAAENVSLTIPGRWSRSLADAEWAIERGIKVRVVKGQWPDPTDPHRDMAAGLLEVIDRLAGRARHVAIGSHDLALVKKAVNRLRAAGTSCELEQLFGSPMRKNLYWARAQTLGVRVYVPYGPGYVPHAISHLRSNPQILFWILKDLMTNKRRASGS
jgi:proline dehydrogenase